MYGLPRTTKKMVGFISPEKNEFIRPDDKHWQWPVATQYLTDYVEGVR